MRRWERRVTWERCVLRALTASVALSLISSNVLASGFRVPETSVAGLSTANALVANHKELGAFSYNPAAMSFHEGNHLVLGVAAINPNTSYTPPGGSSIDATTKDLFGVPNLYFMGDLENNWSWGLAINSPFGLETRWSANTFPTFTPPSPFAGLGPSLSKLQMINFNPNASVKVGKNTSVAFGVNAYLVKSLAFNTSLTEIDGSGDGVGLNFGVMHVFGKWTFGLSYRSAVDTELTGNFKTPAGSSPGTPAGVNVKADLEFPDLLQLGARFQATKSFAIEFDIDHTGWSSFNKLDINSTVTGQTVVSTANNWDDATAFRLGGTWDINPKTQLRFGYAFDPTPQPDEFFSARIPDADRQLLSIGVAYKTGKWQFEAGYMYAFLDDRTINSTKSFAAQAAGGNLDPNGTDAFNGKYESDVNLLGLGATYSF